MVEIFPQQISQTAKKAEDIARNILTQDNTFFSQMGMFYLGPIDGHDVETLVKILKNLNDGSRHGPILLHVVTEKGKGHPFSKVSDEKYHAVSKFNVVTGNSVKSSSNIPTYTEVFADTLCNIAEDNEKITAITAAMPSGTGLNKFKERFENRFFDVGIAEQHAVTFAAGLASQGIQPFVAIYSTFLQRAYDQVIHDVVIQKLPVKFMLDRAGLVGADGSTHAGAFDLAYLLCLPNVVVMAPSDENELKDMVYTSSLYNLGPIFCRYPRGEATGMEISKKLLKLPIGKGRIIKEGTDIAILSIGTLLETALEVSKKLESEGYNITVADARFAKPIDEDLLLNLYKNHKILFIVEEGSRGGFSSHCLNIITSSDLFNTNSKIIRTLNLPDLFQEHASQNEQLTEANLDTNGIYNKIKFDIESLKIKLNLKTNKGFKNN
jgi:1-deoxy-D-xylulose-5-phosphate synthase